MAVIPLIKTCVKNGCTKLSITDYTGLYDVTTNPTGYGATNNITGSGDTGFSATITIDGGTPIDVAAQVADPIAGTFTYDDIDITLADGWHTIVYKVGTTAAGIRSNTVKIFVSCAVKCCVEQKMMELLNYDPCKDASKIAVTMHIWSLYLNMKKAAASCGQSEATNLLTRLQAVCGTTTDCGCS